MILYDEVICIKKIDYLSVGGKYIIDSLDNSGYIRIKNDANIYNFYPEIYFTTIQNYRNMLIEEILE
jgi:hypothetical protein